MHGVATMINRIIMIDTQSGRVKHVIYKAWAYTIPGSAAVTTWINRMSHSYCASAVNVNVPSRMKTMSVLYGRGVEWVQCGRDR